MAIWKQPRKVEQKFRSYEMSCEMKSTCEISQGVSQLWNHLQAHTCATSQVETPFSQLQTTLRNHLQAGNQVANHLQVAKSQIQLAKSKFKLAKWIIQRVNHLAKSTCAISDICNRLVRFFLKIFCKFLFSPCNQSKILLGYFLENIFYIYIFEPM